MSHKLSGVTLIPKGKVALAQALCLTHFEDADNMRKSPLSEHIRSTVLHETSHVQTVVGTDFYSAYALRYLRDGPGAAASLISRDVVELMEAVPSALQLYGDERHTCGTGTAASESAARMVERVVRAAKDYYLVAVSLGLSATRDETAHEQGLDMATLYKRSIVTGIARAVLNCIAYELRATSGASLAPAQLIAEFIGKLSSPKPEILPRPSESLYQHIGRLMWPQDHPRHPLLITEQLREALSADPSWLLSNVQLLPALLRMEFMVYDHSVLRYSNFFNSAYPDPKQMRQAIAKWLMSNANPFRLDGCTRSLAPAIGCFTPLQIDGKRVIYHISEHLEHSRNISKLAVFLQIREFVRQLPALLTYIHGAPHPLFAQLAAEADTHSLAYLTRIESALADFHGTAQASAYWSPDSYRLVSHLDPNYGAYLELELQ